jgi:hypothetical protein
VCSRRACCCWESLLQSHPLPGQDHGCRGRLWLESQGGSARDFARHTGSLPERLARSDAHPDRPRPADRDAAADRHADRDSRAFAATGNRIWNAVWSPTGDAIAASLVSFRGGSIIRSYPIDGGKTTTWFSINGEAALPGVCSGCAGGGTIADLAGWRPQRGSASGSSRAARCTTTTRPPSSSSTPPA